MQTSTKTTLSLDVVISIKKTKAAASSCTVASTSTATRGAPKIDKTHASSTATLGAPEIKEIDTSVRFDVLSDHSNHTYAHLGGQFPSETQKKIMQEWKLLQTDLPESISARAYEKRIDLLTAVIVGADGTPYHDGLFFFDLAFPTDYPRQPPLVHYRSYGYRINPNLYSNGKVCLSLLNTWHGQKRERWNPNESTVLQILLSIQALVLNERPFYNEPGEKSSEVKSLTYNENTFLLSCKTMTWVMSRPPKGFEGFVVSHFRERARKILSACEAYVNGQAQVGHFKSDGINGGGSSCSSLKLPAVGSQKFRKSLSDLYPSLFSSFLRKGALLHGIKKDLQVQQGDSLKSAHGIKKDLQVKQEDSSESAHGIKKDLRAPTHGIKKNLQVKQEDSSESAYGIKKDLPAPTHGIKKNLQVQQEDSSESYQVPTKKKSGLKDKIIGKIKKVLGLMKNKKVNDDANLQSRASS